MTCRTGFFWRAEAEMGQTHTIANYTELWGATRRPHREEGYILLFTLGVLAVISVLVLSMSVTLRLDAQLVAREKTRLQDEYVLRGAVQYLVARLSVTARAVKDAAARPIDPVERRKLWWSDEGPYVFQFEGRTVTIQLEDAGVLPDVNLLTLPEWARLFQVLGVTDGQRAEKLASVVIATRGGIVKHAGSAGFNGLDELVGQSFLPRNLTLADSNAGQTGLEGLVAIGTGLKQLDINRSPIQLFKVLGDFSEEQLSKLKSERARGEISLDAAQRLILNSPIKLMTGKSSQLRAILTLKPVDGAGTELHGIALLRPEGDLYKVVNQTFADAF